MDTDPSQSADPAHVLPPSGTVAVLTPSLPEREQLRSQAMASVDAQTRPATTHLVGIDYARVGIGGMLNQLAQGADAEWLARLDDDDLLKPNHLEVLASGMDSADVIYTWCDIAPVEWMSGVPMPSVLGAGGWTPNQEFNEEALRRENYIPATTLIRKSLWAELGGWALPGFGSGPQPNAGEDWEFWLRALDAGARFLCIPQVTWTYRFHGENLWFR